MPVRTTQCLPFKIQLAVGAAAVVKNELAARWKEMSATVPDLVQAIDAKVAELGAGGKVPKGLGDARFAAGAGRGSSR